MGALDHAKRAHALLSASGASRWLNCTPSARLEDQYTEEGKSVHAAEGTLAHEFADTGLRHAAGQIDTETYESLRSDLIANDSEGFHGSEMDTEVQKYIDFVMEQYAIARKATPGAILSVEDSIDLTNYVPEGFGSNDAVIIADDTLFVGDLKYGRGVQVEAKENPQLMLYGLGALYVHGLSYDIRTVSLNIIQPRLNHISTWEISAEDLQKWGDEYVKPRAKKAFEGKGVQKSGEWCRWCKVKATCATLAADMVKLAKNDFTDKEPIKNSVHELTEAQLLEIYGKIPILNFWASAVADHLLQEAKKGRTWPGYKLVHGRTSRQWLDEDKVKEVLLAELYESEDFTNTKLKGIGDIEKLVKKANFEGLLGRFIIKPEGAPTLVPDSDKRPAIGLGSAREDFK